MRKDDLSQVTSVGKELEAHVSGRVLGLDGLCVNVDCLTLKKQRASYIDNIIGSHA